MLRHLQGKGFKLRATTRKPDSDKAMALAEQGVEVVKGDMDDEVSLKATLKGVWGVFGVQNTWEAGVRRKKSRASV